MEIDLPVPAMQDKVSLVLPLPADPHCLWQQLGAKVRNQVRKAERSGLTVESGGAEKLNDFYDIFAVNMRDLGSPVHARGFFQAIFEVWADQARVFVVRKDRQPIGGLIALAFKHSLVVPWASSLRQYFSLCPNMLLYWETLRAACTEGFRHFDFGRSSRHVSTYRFKRQWGAVEEPLYWYTIPLAPNHSRRFSSVDKNSASYAQLWQHLPLGITRWLGPHIRKYLTQ
jgi:FemAB-related protein (PEP-CTERM system-associated)